VDDVWQGAGVGRGHRPTDRPTLTGHTSTVHAVAIGRVGDRDFIATGGDDKTVRIWGSLAAAPSVIDLLNPAHLNGL
jgi:hypothetical protein